MKEGLFASGNESTKKRLSALESAFCFRTTSSPRLRAVSRGLLSRSAGLLSAFLLCLPPSLRGASVTVITHGYNDVTTTWITAMANSIAVRLGGLNKVSQFTLKIGRDFIG